MSRSSSPECAVIELPNAHRPPSKAEVRKDPRVDAAFETPVPAPGGR